MKNIFLIFIGFIIVFITSACENDIIDESITLTESTTDIEISNSEVSTATSKNSSSFIIGNYLTPIEVYSDERTNKAEFVMLHFCSAILVNTENPYDINKVRQMLIDYGASIHYIIDRDGTVYCYIPETRVAWHAGNGT